MFKNLAEMNKPKLDTEEKPVFVHSISCLGGFRNLESPTLDVELRCPVCDGFEHACVFENPQIKNDRKSWICLNLKCGCFDGLKDRVSGYTPTTLKRAVEWPVFCEEMALGNKYHDVSFEKINQTMQKLEFMKKFALNPSEILLMQGKSQLGKTYASLGICELFTRSSASCYFTTQRKLLKDWLAIPNYVNKITNVALLVIDDFGLMDLPPGFMSEFMEIINTRIQWTNRGTIISTNLTDEHFIEVCGEPVLLRLNTGQKLIFTGEPRTNKTFRR